MINFGIGHREEHFCEIILNLGHHEEHFCDIILNLDQWFNEMLFKDISYLELRWPFCLAQPNHLCNFGRGLYEEHFCEIIFNLDQWLRRC